MLTQALHGKTFNLKTFFRDLRVSIQRTPRRRSAFLHRAITHAQEVVGSTEGALLIIWKTDVIEMTREIIAYGLIGLIVVVAVPIIGRVMIRRKREKLRRRGIKRYGH